ALTTDLEAAFAGADAAEWVARLGEAGVPAGPINDVGEAFAFAEELGLEPWVEVDGVRTVRPAMTLSTTPAAVRRRPPRLGEHDAEIRAWLTGDRPSADRAGELARRGDDDVGAGRLELLAAADPPRDADGTQAVRARRDHVERAVADHRPARRPERAERVADRLRLALGRDVELGPGDDGEEPAQAEGGEERLGERLRLGRRDAEAAARVREPGERARDPGRDLGVGERGDRVALPVARDARGDEVRVGRRADDLGERERQRRPDVAVEVGRVAAREAVRGERVVQ